jgi:hypothetical protein
VPTTPESEKLPRPRQVTLAAALVMGASGMLVVSVFERLGDLRSIESRLAIEEFINQPPGSDLGLDLESVLDILYVVSMVAAGLATAAAILGFHVLKRNRSARIGLSVLALPLFLCGLVTGGVLASVVAASVAMLWLSPSRQWFAGTTPEPVPSNPSNPSTPTTPAPAPPPVPTAPPLPPPGPSAAQQPPPSWPAYAATQPPPWVPPAAPPPRRPTAVAAACAITWACCALAALMSVLLVGVLGDGGRLPGLGGRVRTARRPGVPAAALGRHRAGRLGGGRRAALPGRLLRLTPARRPRPAGRGDGRPAAPVLGAAVAAPARRPRCRSGSRHDEMSR